VTCDDTGCVDPEEDVRVTVNPDWNAVPSTEIVRCKEDEVKVDGLMPVTVGELFAMLVDLLAFPHAVSVVRVTVRIRVHHQFVPFMKIRLFSLPFQTTA